MPHLAESCRVLQPSGRCSLPALKAVELEERQRAHRDARNRRLREAYHRAADVTPPRDALLPSHAHPSPIGGSAPEWVKELNYNTLMHYGVGPQDAFGAQVGKALRFVDVSVQRRGNGERMEATTVAEVGVTKRASFCLRSVSVPIYALSCIHHPAVHSFILSAPLSCRTDSGNSNAR